MTQKYHASVSDKKGIKHFKLKLVSRIFSVTSNIKRSNIFIGPLYTNHNIIQQASDCPSISEKYTTQHLLLTMYNSTYFANTIKDIMDELKAYINDEPRKILSVHIQNECLLPPLNIHLVKITLRENSKLIYFIHLIKV